MKAKVKEIYNIIGNISSPSLFILKFGAYLSTVMCLLAGALNYFITYHSFNMTYMTYSYALLDNAPAVFLASILSAVILDLAIREQK